jgi:hypothetical protein
MRKLIGILFLLSFLPVVAQENVVGEYMYIYHSDKSVERIDISDIDSITFTVPQIVYEAVDLGLSVKWAACNVGALSPWESGGYYAWGETEEKESYDWNTYKYCNGTYDSLTKYNHNENMGVVDNKMELELSDDAANVNWGGAWRMPSEDEYKELLNKCTWYSSSQNGKNGFLIQSKINGNCIFLPVAGTMYKESLYEFGKIGYYRSNAIISVMPESVDAIQCTLNRRVEWIPLSRAGGVPVRAVCE